MRKIVCFSLLTVFCLAGCSPAQPALPLTPTATPILQAAATITPVPTLAPTSTNTPTATPAPPALVFSEDFSSDLLGWNSLIRNPYSLRSKLLYDEHGIALRFRPEWINPDIYTHMRGANVIALDGDFDIEVMFDRRMRSSGLWFSNGSLTLNSGNWFYVMIEQGTSWDTWKVEKAHIATYTASSPIRFLDYGSHTLPGEIDDFISKQKGQIDLHISFRGDQMTATVNGSPPVTETNRLYAGKKYFLGFIVGVQDDFLVKSFRVWAANNGTFQIVNVARAIFPDTRSTVEASTPATEVTASAPVELTPPSSPTIDSYVGNWRPIKVEGGWAYFAITKQGNTLFVHLFGVCGQSREILCDDGTASTTFEGEPVVLLVDWGDQVMKLILQRDGSMLHVASCFQQMDAPLSISGCDYGFSDFVRK